MLSYNIIDLANAVDMVSLCATARQIYQDAICERLSDLTTDEERLLHDAQLTIESQDMVTASVDVKVNNQSILQFTCIYRDKWILAFIRMEHLADDLIKRMEEMRT